MAVVSAEVRRERGIVSLHVFCHHSASCTTHHRSCQPSSPAGFRSSEEEPACGNRTAGEDSIWRQGSAACPPTASLRPGRQASVQRGHPQFVCHGLTELHRLKGSGRGIEEALGSNRQRGGW